MDCSGLFISGTAASRPGISVSGCGRMKNMNNRERIDELNRTRSLPREQWTKLLSSWDSGDREYAAELARSIAQQHFGRAIYVRGIVEFSNICRNDCLYCGIRRSNTQVSRYRLSPQEILECCEAGYHYGFRTFVLQSGEDKGFSVECLAETVHEIKRRFPDCAATLSVGELSREEYQRLFDAGADRYLLRHETADETHYGRLHPAELSWKNRMRCLHDLKEIGYQTGCGFMVGSPFQKPEHLAADMVFLHDFQPHMIGIGPFIPHKDTPFRAYPAGSVELTLFLLSLCRIMLPDVLLPATTALGTLDPEGREKGVLAGANVIMPNLSPMEVRRNYLLYNNKNSVDMQTELCRSDLQRRLEKIGYGIKAVRGDYGEKTC